ncbi:uncharacterized protein LOC141644025 [Silene latifolia]|uniref:uncharacterized protein LOC141644025 n=1 Tax=Silene latifolia TaxID=37657 RepID=UPI003D77008D
MNLLSLNCLGLGNPDTVNALRTLVRREAPAMNFLCETKLCGRDMRRVRERLGEYNGIEVDRVGRSGGLTFLWKKEVDCNFVSTSVHHVDCHIREREKEWRITGFYGWSAVSDRHLSWELLRLLHHQSAHPWVCIGNFNEIFYFTEMKGGSRAQWQMNNFQSAIDDCGLRDVPWEGYKFTFDNGQSGDANRQCRLDRALCTETWLDLFPYARLFHLDREWSDHAPLRLAFDRREIGSKTRSRFRFEQIWVGEEGCEEAIIRGVEKGQEDLVDSLRACGKELFAWKKTSIGKISRSLELKRKQFARLNEGDRTERSVQKQRKLIAEIASLYRQEEQYWRQRSRALWLRDGDLRVGEEEVSTVAVDYFKGLFTSAEPSNFEAVLEGIEGRVTARMNHVLQAELKRKLLKL